MAVADAIASSGGAVVSDVGLASGQMAQFALWSLSRSSSLDVGRGAKFKFQQLSGWISH